MAKKLTAKQTARRDERVLSALAKGKSFRQIKGVAKSTAWDIAHRYGVTSKNA